VLPIAINPKHVFKALFESEFISGLNAPANPEMDGQSDNLCARPLGGLGGGISGMVVDNHYGHAR
jgi:hypothetical protein